MKEQFRKHRFRNPEAETTKEFQALSIHKQSKAKDGQLNELLNKFAELQASKGQERITRKSGDFEESRDSTTNRKLNYRQVCSDNQLDVWGGLEVDAKIQKLCALGYYTRKPLKAKELKHIKEVGMNESAGYSYTVKEEKTTSSQGTGSSSSYAFETDLKNSEKDEVVLVQT